MPGLWNYVVVLFPSPSATITSVKGCRGQIV